MIKAVIFDCFGVLVTEGWLPYKARHFGHDQRRMQEATDLNKSCDAGFISYQDFLVGIAGLAGLSVQETRNQIESNVANTPLFTYIKELKPLYKLGFLSNAGANFLNDLFSPEQLGLFDALNLSYQTGFAKPDSRAYSKIAEKLGVQTEAWAFIDAQERQCQGAQAAGMQAIHYKNFEQSKLLLETLLHQV